MPPPNRPQQSPFLAPRPMPQMPMPQIQAPTVPMPEVRLLTAEELEKKKRESGMG